MNKFRKGWQGQGPAMRSGRQPCRDPRILSRINPKLRAPEKLLCNIPSCQVPMSAETTEYGAMEKNEFCWAASPCLTEGDLKFIIRGLTYLLWYCRYLGTYLPIILWPDSRRLRIWSDRGTCALMTALPLQKSRLFATIVQLGTVARTATAVCIVGILRSLIVLS